VFLISATAEFGSLIQLEAQYLPTSFPKL